MTWDIDGAGESRVEVWEFSRIVSCEGDFNRSLLCLLPEAHVVLLAFDLTDSVSLENAAETWGHEIKKRSA